jgi:hypothetical protein
MKEKLFLLYLLLLVGLSWQCNNSLKTPANDVVSDSVPKNKAPVYLFDSLEHFFGNENWLVKSDKDTSYLLFSRQNDTYIKVYQYKISNGDSINNIISAISVKEDHVIWGLSGRQLVLQKAIGKQTDWKTLPDTTTVSFLLTDKDKIVWQEGSKKIFMVKTITLSDFLVRSRYDFIHRTHYAFDTITFNWRQKAEKDNERRLIKAGGH